MRWGRNVVNLTVTYLTTWSKFSGCSMWRESPSRAEDTLETSKQTWGLRKPRQLELMGQSSREDRAEYRETCADLRRAPHESAYEYCSAHACEESR